MGLEIKYGWWVDTRAFKGGTDMKRNITLSTEKIISVIVTTLIPAGTNLFVTFLICYFNGESFDVISSIIAMGGALLSALSIFLLYNYLPKAKRLRPFWKYEGKWLQIIPDFKRPVTIFELKYDKQKMQYKMLGINFKLDGLYENGVEFTVHKIVERDYNDGFYYITNPTIEHKNGLGKVSFFETNFDDLVRAEGYFFDSDGKDNCSKKYRTIMIKCDSNFFEKICPDTGALFDINKISPQKILTLSQDFVSQEINIYKKRPSVSIKPYF